MWISGITFLKPPCISGKTAIHESLSWTLVFLFLSPEGLDDTGFILTRSSSCRRTVVPPTTTPDRLDAAPRRDPRHWQYAEATNHGGRSPQSGNASAAIAAPDVSDGRSEPCSAPTTCHCCTRDGASRSAGRPESKENRLASRTPFRFRKGRCFRTIRAWLDGVRDFSAAGGRNRSKASSKTVSDAYPPGLLPERVTTLCFREVGTSDRMGRSIRAGYY